MNSKYPTSSRHERRAPPQSLREITPASNRPWADCPTRHSGEPWSQPLVACLVNLAEPTSDHAPSSKAWPNVHDVPRARCAIETAWLTMPAPDADRRQGPSTEPDLTGERRMKWVSQRKAGAVERHHPLCPLAPLVFADSRAPFSPERNSRPVILRSTSTAAVHSARPETPARSRAKPLAPPILAPVASRSRATETPRANPASARRCASLTSSVMSSGSYMSFVLSRRAASLAMSPAPRFQAG